jgi:hypothetical protein
VRKRTKDDGNVDVDTKSKTLGLEDFRPDKKDPVTWTERHQAGETCLHWRRLPNGAIGYMDARAAKLAPCRFCMGGGILLGKIELTHHAGRGVFVAPTDLKQMEEARRTFIPRRVA